MRVVTLNCFLNPRSLTAGIRLRLIARELRLMAPDIILLQEVILKSCRRWLERCLRSLGYRCYSEEGRWFTRGGLLTAARGVINRAEFTSFRNQGGLIGFVMGDAIMSKGCQRLEATIGSKRLILVNTHLLEHYGWENWRDRNSNLAAQVDEIKAFLQAVPAEANLLVGGDFNFSPSSRFYRQLIDGLELKDTVAERAAWDGTGKHYATHADGRLDYIFYRGLDLGSTKSALVFRAPLTIARSKHYPSDHLGVMCEFG